MKEEMSDLEFEAEMTYLRLLAEEIYAAVEVDQ